MKTFAINTLGCKVNQYESQQIRQLLEQLGLEQVETSKKKPDMVVINTCCVTHTASAKSRQHIRKARRLNPDTVVVVAGCLPSVQTDELSNLGENIHLVRHREDLTAVLKQIVNTAIRIENGSEINCNQVELEPLASFKGQTRAFLKVQDGCDGYCSYCIIPKTRPFVHSRPEAAVLEEARGLVEAGHKEIVVTGIYLGAYGQSSVRRKNWPNQRNNKLADLLDKMAQIPNLARLRLSSLEPGDITQRLLDVFRKHRNIMPHLHLSLQSGSNTVLKRMCRQYNIEEFRDKIESIKSQLDRPAITTDIIVGFPGETDADFQETVDLAKEVGFAKMHIFSFSPRKGTAAALQDATDNRVIKNRSKILRDLDIELAEKFRRQFVGQTDSVLVENNNGNHISRSERYFKVYLEGTGENFRQNDLLKVKLIKNRRYEMVGRLISIKSEV